MYGNTISLEEVGTHFYWQRNQLEEIHRYIYRMYVPTGSNFSPEDRCQETAR